MTRLLLLAWVMFATPAAAAVRFALVAGNNLGRDADRPLRWAEADAQRVHGLFTELGGVHAGRAVLLLNGSDHDLQLGLAQLRGQVEEARRRGERTELFVYYAGHGDREALHLAGRRVALATLGKWLEAVPADATVTIIDACRSSPVRSGGTRGARRAPAFEVRYAREAGPRGRVLIHSAGVDEVAQESDDLRGGFFTHHLLTALRGAADADGDKQVTLGEAYGYAYHRTLSTSFGTAAAIQHPELNVDLAGEGELTVTSLARAGALLTLRSGLGGEVMVVEDASARVVAELRLGPTDEISLALPAGAYRLIRRNDGKVYAGRVTLHWSGTHAVTPASLDEQPRVAALQRGALWDPTPWRAYFGLNVARPSALGAGTSVGARVALERRLEAPFFWTVRGNGATASGTNAWRSLRHTELTLGGGLGGAWVKGPFRAASSLTADVIGLHATSERHEAERLRRLGLSATDGDGWTVGPGLTADVSAAIAVTRALELRVGGGAALTWLNVDQSVHGRVSPFAHAGIGHTF